MEKPNDMENYEYFSREELLQRPNIKRDALYQKIRIGVFPPPVYFGMYPSYIKHEVEHFLKMELQMRLKNGKPKPDELRAMVAEMYS